MQSNTPGTESCTPWQLIQNALPLVFNSNHLTHFHCLSEPDTHFKFHNSVVPSRSETELSMPDLFACSTKFLQPLLHSVKKPESSDQIEEVLGANFYDALSFLAVLSSTELHKYVDIIAAEKSVPADVRVVNFGMNATVSMSGFIVGRENESQQIEVYLRRVFEDSLQAGQASDHCPIVLLHGEPGTGKSSLAFRELEKLQKEFDRKKDVYRHIVYGRGAQAVRNGLHAMGLALLGMDSDAPVDKVLGSLKTFLQKQRFVILADDIDTHGAKELLKNVPKSSEPCALILTTQFSDAVCDICLGPTVFQFSGIRLDVLKPQESLELVQFTCLGYQKFEDGTAADFKELLFRHLVTDDWLPKILDKEFGHLPVAVRVFADWLCRQFEGASAGVSSLPQDATTTDSVNPDRASAAIRVHVIVTADALKENWAKAVAEENPVMENSPARGFRGLSATVRLWLYSIDNIKDRNKRDDAICFLKIVSLSDPNDVNLWSLFEPEEPLFFTSSQKLPQRHLQKTFEDRKLAGIRSRTNEALERDKGIRSRTNEALERDNTSRIPLLSELATPTFSFRTFFDQIVEVAPVLKRNTQILQSSSSPSSPMRNDFRPIITMHQLVQKAVLDQLRAKLPESNLIMLALLESRTHSPGHRVDSNLKAYLSDIAHTAHTILHNLETEIFNNIQIYAAEKTFKRLCKMRIDFRIGRERDPQDNRERSLGLAGLFKKLDYDQKSFELASEILKPEKFPEVTLRTLMRVSRRQHDYSEVLNEYKYRWWYILRAQIVRCKDFEADEDSVIGTHELPVDNLQNIDHTERLHYFLTECDELFCKVRAHFQQNEAHSWLNELFISSSPNPPILQLLLEAVFDEGDTELKLQAQTFCRQICDFLNIPEDKRWQPSDNELKELVTAKKHIHDRLMEKKKGMNEPLCHNLNIVEYSRNYIHHLLAESSLQHAMLLEVSEARSRILEAATKWARSSERYSIVTKGNDINCVYRKLLVARCLGAAECFKESMFNFSLSLICYQKYHDEKKNSPLPQAWLDDCLCNMSATLRHMQLVKSNSDNEYSAEAEYLQWLKDGFEGCERKGIDDENIRELQALTFKNSHRCQNCDRNFEGLICPRALHSNDRKIQLIDHYKILTMLLKRQLQGGYFVRPQDVEIGQFAAAEMEQRLQVFRFFVTEQVFDSVPGLFQCDPDIPMVVWKMMLQDLSVPEKCKEPLNFDAENQIDFKNIAAIIATYPQPSQENFDALASSFQNHLENETIRKKFFNLAFFANEEHDWAQRMLQWPTFRQRLDIITEMEEQTRLKANRQHLKILLQSSDIKNFQDEALRFFNSTKNIDALLAHDVLGPVLLLCADCNNTDRLRRFWRMGLANQRSLGSIWPGIMNKEVRERYHKLKESNQAWEYLVSWLDIKKTGYGHSSLLLVNADHTDESRGPSDGAAGEGGGGWGRGASAGGGAAAAARRVAPPSSSKWGRGDPERGGSRWGSGSPPWRS